jgi:ABC-type phosphate/phosphonate transport system ATPase subunit
MGKPVLLYCNRHMGITNNTVVFDTTVKTKQSVIKMEHSQEFQESLTRDYPALVHSVTWAQSCI